jgi:scyllo-inositol 2-dehydrogenase (NADP+)
MSTTVTPHDTRLRVAVIGLGLAGRTFHIPHLVASGDFDIKVLCARSELSESLIADLSLLCPHARLEKNGLTAILSVDVDVVVIATPDATHAALGMAALRAGKHVLIDKPLTQTLEEAQALLHFAAGGPGGRLCCMPYQNRRYCGDFVTVKELLEAHKIGDVVEYEAHYNRYRPQVRQIWKELDRGSLANLGPHVIDQALLLFGEPTRVWACIKELRDGAITDDAFEIQLFYDHDKTTPTGKQRLPGLITPPKWRVVLRSTMLAADNEEMFIIHGTKGSFKKCGLDGQEAFLSSGGPVLPTATGYGIEAAKDHGKLTHSDGTIEMIPTAFASYATLYSKFAIAARSQHPLASQEISPQMAILLMRVMATARKSSVSGNTEMLIIV